MLLSQTSRNLPHETTNMALIHYFNPWHVLVLLCFNAEHVRTFSCCFFPYQISFELGSALLFCSKTPETRR